MDISTFSTEALRHELRLRQARPAATPKWRQLDHPAFSEVDEESEENSLFVPERRSGRTSSGFVKSFGETSPIRGSFSTTAEKFDRTSRQCKKLPHKSNSYGHVESLEQPTLRKRRQSQSCEIIDSAAGLTPRGYSSTAMAHQGRKLFKRTDAKRRKTAALQLEYDRRLAERLAAEEEDDLLMLMGGQWTKAHPGTKGRPIDLDRHTRFSGSSRQAPHSSFSVQHGNKSLSKPSRLHQSNTLDAAIAHQLQKEEAQAQEARLREAASRTRDCAVCGDATLVIELPSLSSCAHDAEICADCYATWLGSQLAENGWQEVKCPGQSCKVNLTYEEIKSYASKEVFERFDAFQARNALSADPNFRWCRAEGCSSGQIHDQDEVGNVFICVDCHARFCTVHDGLYHDDETCEEYEYRTSGQKDRDERKREDEASEKAVQNLAKKCPKEGCGSPIQKNGGCNHITCMFKTWGVSKVRLLTKYRLEVPTPLLLCLSG